MGLCVDPSEYAGKTMNFILTDLSKLTVGQLVDRTRRLFACSLGLFFLISIHFAGLFLLPAEKASHSHIIKDGVITLVIMELLTWISFARTWRELERKTKIDDHA